MKELVWSVRGKTLDTVYFHLEDTLLLRGTPAIHYFEAL